MRWSPMIPAVGRELVMQNELSQKNKFGKPAALNRDALFRRDVNMKSAKQLRKTPPISSADETVHSSEDTSSGLNSDGSSEVKKITARQKKKSASKQLRWEKRQQMKQQLEELMSHPRVTIHFMFEGKIHISRNFDDWTRKFETQLRWSAVSALLRLVRHPRKQNQPVSTTRASSKVKVLMEGFVGDVRNVLAALDVDMWFTVRDYSMLKAPVKPVLQPGLKLVKKDPQAALRDESNRRTPPNKPLSQLLENLIHKAGPNKLRGTSARAVSTRMERILYEQESKLLKALNNTRAELVKQRSRYIGDLDAEMTYSGNTSPFQIASKNGSASPPMHFPQVLQGSSRPSSRCGSQSGLNAHATPFKVQATPTFSTLEADMAEEKFAHGGGAFESYLDLGCGVDMDEGSEYGYNPVSDVSQVAIDRSGVNHDQQQLANASAAALAAHAAATVHQRLQSAVTAALNKQQYSGVHPQMNPHQMTRDQLALLEMLTAAN